MTGRSVERILQAAAALEDVGVVGVIVALAADLHGPQAQVLRQVGLAAPLLVAHLRALDHQRRELTAGVSSHARQVRQRRAAAARGLLALREGQRPHLAQQLSLRVPRLV